jgi:hypothetical protein
VAEQRGDAQGDEGQEEHGGVDAGLGAVELLHPVAHPAQQDAQPQHQQQVAQDGAGDGRLHQIQQVLFDGEDGDDELGGVAQRAVEEAAQLWPRVRGQLLRGFAQDARQRDHRQRRAPEHNRRAPAQELARNGHWREDE